MPEADYLRRSPIRFDQPDYQACYEYWLELRGSRRSPAWSEWNWERIPYKLIPYFIVVDVDYEPLVFKYRFWGTACVSLHNKDFTGLTSDSIRSPITKEITEGQYKDVVESHEAIGARYIIQARESGVPYMQTSLRMPMSSDGDRVSQIVSYVDWSKNLKEIREDHIKEFGE